MIYFFIFLAKILENTLSTFRLIIVANGKKIFGAILQLCINLLWISTTGITIINTASNYITILSFVLGSTIGSFFGSLLEEKLGLGYILITYEANNATLNNVLINNKIKYTSLLTKEKKTLFYIISPRKKQNHILKLIRKYDYNPSITTINIKPFIFDN